MSKFQEYLLAGFLSIFSFLATSNADKKPLGEAYRGMPEQNECVSMDMSSAYLRLKRFTRTSSIEDVFLYDAEHQEMCNIGYAETATTASFPNIGAKIKKASDFKDKSELGSEKGLLWFYHNHPEHKEYCTNPRIENKNSVFCSPAGAVNESLPSKTDMKSFLLVENYCPSPAKLNVEIWYVVFSKEGYSVTTFTDISKDDTETILNAYDKLWKKLSKAGFEEKEIFENPEQYWAFFTTLTDGIKLDTGGKVSIEYFSHDDRSFLQQKQTRKTIRTKKKKGRKN